MNKVGEIARDIAKIIDLFVFALVDMFVDFMKNGYKYFIILACWKYCFGF